MPRKNSLTRADFARAERAKFRRERGSLFMLSFGVLAGQKPADLKAACVVSKKTAARAADRNLIKRRWRAAMRQCFSAVPAPSTGESADFVAWPAHLYPMCPSVLVFYAMRQAKGASFTDIKNDVQALVRRAGIKLLVP